MPRILSRSVVGYVTLIGIIILVMEIFHTKFLQYHATAASTVLSSESVVQIRISRDSEIIGASVNDSGEVIYLERDRGGDLWLCSTRNGVGSKVIAKFSRNIPERED